MKKSKSLSLFLAVLLVVASIFSQISPIASAAEAKAISKSDFTVTYGKQKINFYTMTPKQAEKIFGGRFILVEEESYSTYYLTKKNVTVALDSDDTFLDAEFTGNVKTARGIKIGSTLKQVLNVYPNQLLIEPYSYNGTTTYVFGNEKPENFWNLSEKERANARKNADYVFAICFDVNCKTLKVESITISNQLTS